MTDFTFPPEKRLSRLTLARAENLNTLFAEIAAMSSTKISFTIDGDVDANGGKIINAANGTDPTDLVTKQQLDATAFAPALPGQTGNAGKFITTDGTSATWVDAPVRFDIAQLLSDLQKSIARSNISAASVASVDLKADSAATTAALATKAEASAVSTALALKVGVEEQSLTAAQQGQARANIGVAYNKWETVLYQGLTGLTQVNLTGLGDFRFLRWVGDYRPSVNGGLILMQFSADNLSNVISSGYADGYIYSDSVNAPLRAFNAATGIQMCRETNSGFASQFQGSLGFFNIARHTVVTGSQSYITGTSEYAIVTSLGYAPAATAYNSLRLTLTSATAGSVHIEGIRG